MTSFLSSLSIALFNCGSYQLQFYPTNVERCRLTCLHINILADKTHYGALKLKGGNEPFIWILNESFFHVSLQSDAELPKFRGANPETGTAPSVFNSMGQKR